MRTYYLIFLLSTLACLGQESTQRFVSRKGVYQITYNPSHWVQQEDATLWDAAFHDTYNLVNCFFSEYDYFISEAQMKRMIKGQFKGLGSLKKLRLYPKTIQGLAVTYFDCSLKYAAGVCHYEGFVYNGKGGAVQITFGYQEESPPALRELITEFYSGLRVSP